MLRDKNVFCDALRDYRYLLDRGYSRESVLHLITSRYNLSSIERSILYRCVHPTVDAIEVKRKTVTPEDVRGEILIIDGYNVLITLDTSLRGDHVYLGDDGIVRDVRKSYRKYEFKPLEVSETLKVIGEHLKILEPEKAVVIYDSQISWSGKLKGLTEDILSGNIECEVLLVKYADKTIIRLCKGSIVSTSDIVVLKEAERIFDLSAYIIRAVKPETINSTVLECMG